MSVRVMTLVWDAQFPTPTAKLIALKLADCANDDGANVFPSRRTVERATMCSPAAVKKWLGFFEKAGLLIVDRRSAGGAQKDTTVRRFNMPLLRALACGTKTFDGAGPSIAIVDAVGTAGGHVVAGAWDNPATTYPSPGHVVADTGPPNGPNPSGNRDSTVTPPRSPARRGKGAKAPLIEIQLEEARVACAADENALKALDAVLAPIVSRLDFVAPSPAAALFQLAQDIALQRLTDVECAAVVGRVIAKRKANVKASDIADEVQSQTVRRPAATTLRGNPDLAPDWDRVCESLRQRIGQIQFDAWFSTVVPESWDGRRLRLATDVQIVARHVEREFATPLRLAVQVAWPSVQYVEVVRKGSEAA